MFWDDQLRHVGAEVPPPGPPKKVKKFKYFGCKISYKMEEIFKNNQQYFLKYWEL